ncbi:MAG: nitrous oxide reductase family maturation protein NosD [Candidatus Lokiarchaeia archaeon]
MRGFRSKGIKAVVLVSVLLFVPTVSFVAVQGQNLNDYSVVFQALFPYVNSPSGHPIASKAVSWGDVTFSNTSSYSNIEIVLNGNLTVASGGVLTLTNVTLIVNCSSDGQHRIEVQNEGALYINDTDGNPSTGEDASNITAYVPDNNFLFWVKSGATFQMNNSELHYCGYYYESSNRDHAGLWINTNNTIIENNTFKNNYYGIVLFNAHYNTIRGNNIINSGWHGIYLGYCTYNNISGNTATNNYFDGFALYSSSYNNLMGNVAIDSNYGFALYSDSDNNNLTGNTAIDNYNFGFAVFSAHNNLTGNNATKNDYGFWLEHGSYNNLTGNNATGNYQCGFWLWSGSDNNNLSGNTALNNPRGFLLNSSSSNVLLDNWAVNSSGEGYVLVGGAGNDLSGSVVANFLRVRAVEMFGSPLSGVDVRMDVDGATVFEGQTGVGGYTDWIQVAYQVYSGLTPSDTVVEVWVTGVGYRVVNMSSSHTETFIDMSYILPLTALILAFQNTQAIQTAQINILTYGVIFAVIAITLYILRRKT